MDAKLASLRKEVEAIHFANELYWAQKEHSQVAVAEYERRQERSIRSVTSWKNWKRTSALLPVVQTSER